MSRAPEFRRAVDSNCTAQGAALARVSRSGIRTKTKAKKHIVKLGPGQ
jgi:hypothetical protein